MTDQYIDNWLKKADSDLKIVEHELELSEEETVKDGACFHCQQAVEKYLKAFLISHKVDFPRTHSIEYLLEQAAKIDERFSDIDVDELSDFGVDIRYPDSFYVPEIDEVTFYYDLAIKIKTLVLEKIKPVQEKEEDSIAEG
ncbi:MAG: HEPN domain-containing protein [bacterium]|nr:HEPN domain-containing protein [bacterium]